MSQDFLKPYSVDKTESDDHKISILKLEKSGKAVQNRDHKLVIKDTPVNSVK